MKRITTRRTLLVIWAIAGNGRHEDRIRQMLLKRNMLREVRVPKH